MPRSNYEFVYTSGLTAAATIFVAHLGNVSGLFEIGIAHREWLYVSLASNIIAILSLIGRRVIDKYEEDRTQRVRDTPAREKIRQALEYRAFVEEHPIKSHIYALGRRIRAKSAKPIGWTGLALVGLSVVFYLVFAISNIEMLVSEKFTVLRSLRHSIGPVSIGGFQE